MNMVNWKIGKVAPKIPIEVEWWKIKPKLLHQISQNCYLMITGWC